MDQLKDQDQGARPWTPGPHKVDGVNTSTQVGGFQLVWGDGEMLAYVARPEDARLYASAPDLYEALERALAMIGAPADGVHTLDDRDIIPIHFEISGQHLKKLHAALAKATHDA